MKLIHRSELDLKRWDALVEKHAADVFSYSWYLDSCAQDWCVFVDDNFENGIALPFTVKMGIKAISPPIFVRNLDFICNDNNFPARALEEIEKEFPAGHLQLSEPSPLIPVDFVECSAIQRGRTERVYQSIQSEVSQNQQAKRMIAKASKNGITVAPVSDWKAVLEIIRTELSEKISEFTSENLMRLEKLVASLEKENRLTCFGILRNGKLEGGMIFMETARKCVYLKGAASKEVRDPGGMYFCMSQKISETIASGRTFDFGGSGVEGVRRFNLNLGGTDQQYYIYSWNNTPWWFRLTKSMYRKWKKK